MRRLGILRLIALVVAGLIAAAATAAEDEIARLTREVEAVHDAMEKAAIAGDYETVLSYLTEDVVLCADTRQPQRGKAAVRAVYRENEKEEVKIHSISSTIEALWTCGDRIYLRGTFGQSGSSKKHPAPIAIHGSYFEICRRLPDGRHLVEYNIWNLGFNPFEGGQ